MTQCICKARLHRTVIDGSTAFYAKEDGCRHSRIIHWQGHNDRFYAYGPKRVVAKAMRQLGYEVVGYGF